MEPISELVAIRSVKSDQTGQSTSSGKITINVRLLNKEEDIDINLKSTFEELKTIISEKLKIGDENFDILKGSQFLSAANVSECISNKDVLYVILRASSEQCKKSFFHTLNDPDVYIGSIISLNSVEANGKILNEIQKRAECAFSEDPNMITSYINNPFVNGLIQNPHITSEIIRNSSILNSFLKWNPKLWDIVSDKEKLEMSLEFTKNWCELQKSNTELAGNQKNGYDTVMRDIYDGLQDPVQLVEQLKERYSKENKSDDTSKDDEDSESKKELVKQYLTVLLSHMAENSNITADVFSVPYMSKMLQTLGNDNPYINSVIGDNQLFSHYPDLKENFQPLMNLFYRQMQNPDFRTLYSNPIALKALMQVQKGFEKLEKTAPIALDAKTCGLLGRTSNDIKKHVINYNFASSKQPQTAYKNSSENLSTFLAQSVFGIVNTAKLTPERKYEGQLKHLKEMGFANECNNLQALLASNGDIYTVVRMFLANS